MVKCCMDAGTRHMSAGAAADVNQIDTYTMRYKLTFDDKGNNYTAAAHMQQFA